MERGQEERHWSKRFRAEVVVAASIAALAALFLLLTALDPGGGSAGTWLAYYGNAFFAGSPAAFVYLVAAFSYFIVMAFFLWKLGARFFAIIFPRLMKGKAADENPWQTLMGGVKHLPRLLLIAAAVWFIALTGVVMGEANQFARARLQDPLVIGWEHALFQNYVFASLGAIHYPPWLLSFVIWSFLNVSVILVVAGGAIAYLAVDRFRELIIAFCVGILIMLPIWLLIPALSPQDRYVNDVYHLPTPPAIALAIANYRPQPALADFLSSVRAEKKDLPAMPTSTFPSAHVFWAMVVGYYLFRTRRWLGWLGLPFLAASVFGTVLLAQHYFMDIPAAVAVAAFAIWLARDAEAAAPAPVAVRADEDAGARRAG
jgi:PAP2 superfamily